MDGAAMISPDSIFWVSAGTAEVTPHRTLPLAGYRTFAGRRAHNSADPLEVNAIVIRNGDTLCAFVSFDFLYVGGEIRRAVTDALKSVVAPENLFMAASHTHFAPATDPQLPRLGVANADYVQYVARVTADLICETVAAEGRRAVLQYAVGAADHSINRLRLRKL